MRQQGMELWRPDWCLIYDGRETVLPDVAGELLTVTRETLRLALSALQKQNEEDYYHNSGMAAEELRHVLSERT